MQLNNQLLDAAVELIRFNPDKQSVNYSIPLRWDKKLFNKMIMKSEKDRLIIAAALIAAKIDVILHEEEIEIKRREDLDQYNSTYCNDCQELDLIKNIVNGLCLKCQNK